MSRVLKAGVAAVPASWTALAVPGASEDDDEVAVSAGEAMARAEDVLARARARASRLIAEAEDVRVEAVALHAGAVERGLHEGRETACAEAASLVRDARSVLEAAWEERRRVLGDVLADCAEVACALARRVLGRELEARPDEVVGLARRLLADLPPGPVVLRAHAVDAAYLEARREDLRAGLDVRVDASLSVGDLVVEGPDGVHEATVAGRLLRVEEAVRTATARLAPEAASAGMEAGPGAAAVAHVVAGTGGSGDRADGPEGGQATAGTSPDGSVVAAGTDALDAAAPGVPAGGERA